MPDHHHISVRAYRATINLVNSLVTPDGVRENIIKAISAKIQLTNERSNICLFSSLIKRRVGTDKIERAAKTVAGRFKRNESLIVEMLKAALEEVRKKEKETAKDYFEKVKEAKRKMPPGWRRRELEMVIREEGNMMWEANRKRNSKKKDHLEEKYKQNIVEHEYEDIKISDEALGEDDTEEKIAAYGVEVNEDEKSFLRLPKNFTDVDKIDEHKMKCDIQMMSAKLRMDVKNKEQNEEVDLDESWKCKRFDVN